MSYATTNIVVYGVNITSDKAKELQELLEPHTVEGDIRIVPKNRCKVEQYREIYKADCYSHDTDSRIHDLCFELDGRTHTFGIYCGSKGYAWSDNIEKILKHIPSKAKKNFKDFCAPVLAQIGIKIEPKTHLVTQVW